jgi:hypothetical protein
VITGASSGIGAELARLLAERGHGVTLVARREDRLRALASEIADRHGVRAEVLGCDLSDPEGRVTLAGAVEELGLEVQLLANNAGFGSAGPFHDLESDTELRLVRTNVEAVVDLCSRWVPSMVERGQGAVLNVASTAAFQPLPRQATYSASKAFVLAFTEALSSDLSGTGVTATALCPGPVRTEFTDRPGFEAADNLPGFAWMTAHDVARAGLRGLERGKRVVVPGAINGIGALAGQHAPRSVLLSLARRASPLGK